MTDQKLNSAMLRDALEVVKQLRDATQTHLLETENKWQHGNACLVASDCSRVLIYGEALARQLELVEKQEAADAEQ
jgi:uncharacterized membrane protein